MMAFSVPKVSGTRLSFGSNWSVPADARGALPDRRRRLAEATVRMPNLGRYTWVRFEFPCDAPAGQHVIETRTTYGSGTAQPATVPFNLFGMANNAIPKFCVNVT